MRYIADLHIHSKYSRACSKNLTFSNLLAWARAKGIDILGTGDFTHPSWLKEIEEKLAPAEEGLFVVKKEFADEDGDGAYLKAPMPAHGRDVRFILTTELSCIYKKNGKTRRLHLLVFMPTTRGVKRLIAALERQECNLRSDGRPILGFDAKSVLEMALEADSRALVVPAHAWTPWFSVFGSESGFDSLEECFEELTPHIHAIETGLSSDPSMNRHLSALDKVVLISNSDAHGVRKLGREANVFDLETPSYDAIASILRERDRKRFLSTIEFFPEEGKYHVDGHRACSFTCMPEETARLGGICPKCGKPLTRGVLGRVHALADRTEFAAPTVVPFHRIVPLEEVIGEAFDASAGSKKVFSLYTRLLEEIGPELDVLLGASAERIAQVGGERMAEAIRRIRGGRLTISPGYDGVYGTVKIFNDPTSKKKQHALDL